MRRRLVKRLASRGKPSAKGAAGAAPEHGATSRAIAGEAGIAHRKSALAGPKPQASTETLVRQIGGNIYPLGHGWFVFEGLIAK